MAICTYLNQNEIEEWRKVSDEDVNELLQDVNKETGNKYFLKAVNIVKRRGWFTSWFLSPVKETFYTIYIDFGHLPEVQVMNFYMPGGSSINTSIPKAGIIAYFLGVLAGLQDRRMNTTTT